jgi:hypothetical protein
VTVPCQECGRDLASDSPDLRLELTCDDEPIVHCARCWEREFGESGKSIGGLSVPTASLLPSGEDKGQQSAPSPNV